MRSRAAGLLGLVTGLFLALPAGAAGYEDAPGARLRVLDKLTTEVQDVTIANGAKVDFGRLSVEVDACRFPADNRTAEAFAHLTIHQTDVAGPVFKGWMVASSPALSALDNPRYDVWLIRCDVPDLVLPEASPEGEGEEAGGEGSGEADADGATSGGDG